MEQQEKDMKYMRMALDEARRAMNEGEIPIGAVVVCRDRVVARSHNLTETLCDVTAHAEMQAITAAANTLGGKYLTDPKRGYHEYAPRALHPKTNVTGGILEEECRQLMQEFFRQRR